MNTELEVPDETMTEQSVVEVLTEEQVTALTDPQQLINQLEQCRKWFTTLQPRDPLSAKQCAALASTCTFASRHAHDQRTAIVDPHNKIVKDTNEIWMPIEKGFETLGKAKAAEVNQWVEAEREKAAEVQRKEIADAKAKQDELDRKAEEERQEAERLRLEADQAKTIEEAEALHQKADKMEAKADKHELAASQVVTTVVPTQAKTIDLGGSALHTRAPKMIWILPGWDKAKPLKCTDQKLSALVGDLSKLPEGVRFILQHADLNPVYLNKSFGVITFPAPFGETKDYGGSQVRGKS